MNAWNAVGFLAGGLVVTAFCMRDIVHLRIVAVASNVAFLAYGVALGLMPVWLLHLVLLPVNLVRLWQVGSGLGARFHQPVFTSPPPAAETRAAATHRSREHRAALQPRPRHRHAGYRAG